MLLGEAATVADLHRALGTGRGGIVTVDHQRVELPEHLAAEEAEHQPDLGAGDPGADGLGERRRRALLLDELVDDRAEDRREAVGVGAQPARTVHEEHRCGPRLGVEAGEVTYERGGALGALAELDHRGGGLVGRHLRSGTGDPGSHGDGEVPVDEVHVPTLAGGEE